MLVPITRTTLEDVIPAIATGDQYKHYWGNIQDLLKKLLISFVAVVVLFLVGSLLGSQVQDLLLLPYVIAGLYWFWGPVYGASLRNASYRKYRYGGFWRGRILEVYITEDFVNQQETVNDRGELVVVENREKRINVEVGDRNGYFTTIQAPLKRIHKNLRAGQAVEMVVLSNQPDLATIAKVTDAYIPSQNLWVGEYPFLRRDAFKEVSQRIYQQRRQGF